MTLRRQSKRVIGSLVLVMLVLCASAGIALAACPTLNEVQGSYEVCTSGCKTGDLLANANCINSCIGARFKADDARYACEKAERDAAALSAQERIKQQEAENARIEAEEQARQKGSQWMASHGAGLVDVGDEATFVNGDVKLMRDGKVVPFQKGTKIGPADVLMTTGIGPVAVGSQVENIRYGKDTILQRIGFLYNPPRLLEQAGVADAKGLYGVEEEDEWSWWAKVGLDVGSIVTPDLAAMTPLCAKAFAVGQPEICAGVLLGDILVRGGMWFYATTRSDAGAQFVLTPSAFVMHRNTEFTINVAADNATTVTVLDGSVIVMDMASRKGIVLNESQAVAVPKTAAGLSAEDLGRRVVAINPAVVDKFEPKAGQEGGPPALAPSGTAQGASTGAKSGQWPLIIMFSVFVVLVVVIVAALAFVFKKMKTTKKKA